MTRIIAGVAGGRRLVVPAGAATRPTSDRVREALFGMLEARGAIEGARVLDLYAGSGALGLEAASRGAARVRLVENARAAVDVVRRNVETLGLHQVSVSPVTVARFLAGPPEPCDLVLVDPPYSLPEPDLAVVLQALTGGWLSPDALVVVERSSRRPEPTWPVGLTRTDARHYGETTLWLSAGLEQRRSATGCDC